MLRVVKVLNVVLMTLPFVIVWYAFYASKITTPFFRRGNWVVIAVFALFYLLNGRVYDAFLISYQKEAEIVFSQMLSALISNVIIYVLMWLLTRHPPALPPLLLSFGLEFLVSVLWTKAARAWYFKVFPPRRTTVVWDERKGLTRLIEDYGLTNKFRVERTLPIAECLTNLDVLESAEAVFLIGVHSTDRNKVVKYCVANHISAFVIPRIGDVLLSGAKQVHLFHLPILRAESYRPSFEYMFFKRLFDILLSALALAVTSPVMLVVALLIKRTDGGDVLYRQTRMTRDGKTFEMLKFRSMRMDAEKDGVARLSTGVADDRVTKIGRVIRRSRIDELPQFLNILRGDMTIVGPRPERPEIFEDYVKELPEFRLRLQAKAGLTGYAQVYGKYNTTPYDKLLMDLMYLAKSSFAEDVRIMFATIKILASKISTEGVGA